MIMSSCNKCKTSFPEDQLFVEFEQIAGETRRIIVCKECKAELERQREMTRQNFQAQFGEKIAYGSGIRDLNVSVNINKLIDEAMEKKDRSVVLYICENGTSVYVNPYKDEKVIWKGAPGAKRPYCSNCGREAEGAYPFCPWCGEQVAISEEDAMAMSERQSKRQKRLHEALSTIMTKEEE